METTTTIAEKLLAIQEQISSFALEREDQIHGIILCALADGNVLFLGPPGTAKSMTATAFCNRVDDGKIYHTLLSQYSVIEDILGAVDVKQFVEQGAYIRNKKASIAGPKTIGAFIDECYKGTAGVLNTLLNVMNERQINEEGAIQKIDLMYLVGASNEVPSEEDGLQALHDRFNMKFKVGPLTDQSSFMKMLSIKALKGGKNKWGEPNTYKGDPVRITREELLQAREDVKKVEVKEGILKRLTQLRDTLKKVKVNPTDRVFAEAIAFLKAEAFLAGRDTVEQQDLVILKDMLWTDESELKNVRQKVYEIAAPEESIANEVFSKAENVYDRFKDAYTDYKKEVKGLKKTDLDKHKTAYNQLKGEANECGTKLTAAMQQISQLKRTLTARADTDRDKERIKMVAEKYQQVDTWLKEIYDAIN